MRVLLVLAEDRAICESLRAALPETDLLLFEPGVAQAQRRLVSVKVDAVIIDDAPNLGLKALKRMGELTPTSPLVLLSSRSDGESLGYLASAGARNYIVKPFSCEQLREAIDHAIASTQPLPAGSLQNMPPAPTEAVLGQHQVALRWLSRISSQIQDPIRLSQTLVDAATDIFDAMRSAVLLESGGHVRVAACQGIPANVSASARLGFMTGLMRWFDENACLFDRLSPGAPFDAVKEAQVLGARLAMPFMCGGRVCGAILVGDKASARDYSHEERELLALIARSASIAFANTKLYQDMAHQQNRLDSILSNVTAGVVAVATDKTVTMMNQSAERILRMKAADMIGHSVQKLGSSFADVVLRALSSGKPLLRQEVRDSSINATLGISATPCGADGAIAIFTVLAEKKMASEDIAYSPFWEFLATRVAQEIKNPMVAINTFAQLLPKKYESEEFREAFGEVVQKEVARINNVVETLYDFARHPRLVVQESDLRETVHSVIESFGEELKSRSIEVEEDYDPQISKINMDPIYFSQAIHSIVQNSIEAMPAGGKLRIRAKGGTEGCQLVIADSGPGIPEQDAGLIFLPFFSTKEKGMGLGLTMASRILKQHEGDLRLVTNENGGGAFALSLPTSKRAHAEHIGD
jgi:nitrogen-specific signal transduction histidine kinase/DNA-binding response OmpR family regulator